VVECGGLETRWYGFVQPMKTSFSCEPVPSLVPSGVPQYSPPDTGDFTAVVGVALTDLHNEGRNPAMDRRVKP
jgi:hypothetical protein